MAGGRSLAISLGLSALAAIPAAAQARATIAVSATVVDLSAAQTNFEATTTLLTRVSVSPPAGRAPARRDTGTAAILVSYPASLTGSSSDPLVATVVYW